MTPSEFEWACEQTELAYERGRIGKITFAKRMKSFGFKIERIREWLRELDAALASGGQRE